MRGGGPRNECPVWYDLQHPLHHNHDAYWPLYMKSLQAWANIDEAASEASNPLQRRRVNRLWPAKKRQRMVCTVIM